MAEKITIVTKNENGKVLSTKVLEFPDGITIDVGDDMTTIGNVLIVEHEHFMCDAFFLKGNTAKSILKDFNLAGWSAFNNPRITYFGREAAFFHGDGWGTSKLVNLRTGEIIFESTEEIRFDNVKDTVSAIQEDDITFFILKCSKDDHEIYMVVDMNGKKVLPDKYVGKHKKLESAGGIGNVYLLHYIDYYKKKYGIISITIVMEKGVANYVVKQIIPRKHIDKMDVDWSTFSTDLAGKQHYPVIIGEVEYGDDQFTTEYYNIFGKKLKM